MRALWALVGLTRGSAAQGHHGSAQFDTRTEIISEGVITDYDCRNLHVDMVIETSDQRT